MALFLSFVPFRLSGLHMESQATYEMASEGLIRPANSKLPVIYGIKCVHFDSPNFTLGKDLECYYYAADPFKRRAAPA